MSGNRKESTNTRPVVEEPPYLAEGTEVSAKYRGAFCEANIKSVKKLVKCKVNFENGGGNSTVTDDCIIGELKVGADVKVKVPDGQDMAGVVVKITDSSSYTVVFDDGDERTLKRTSLCIKGEKHFNESETLDHLPLTDPENFGTPVMQQGKKSRKGRRSSLSFDVDSKEEEDIPARKKLNVKNDEKEDKVVMIDFTEKKKSFLLPALLLSSTESQCDVKSPESVVVRSFKDGKHIEVHPKDVKEFSKESIVNSTLVKGENTSLKSAVEHAVKYLETKQLPSDWDDDRPDERLKNDTSDHSSSSEAESDGDDNERSEFLKKLTKFLGENGTPLVRSPVLGHRDLDLYKLFKIVSKMKGMDKVKSWQAVYKKMGIPVMTTTATYHIKNAYKRYLYGYEMHTQQDDECSGSGKGKKSNNKSSNVNTSDNNGKKDGAANKDEVTLIGSDSEKDLKELPLSNDNKLPTLQKAGLKRGRGRRKGRSDRGKNLKSPKSPALSPCSPRSISSVSASESTGCPSPADNYCDVRELEGKIDLVLGKSNEKAFSEKDDLNDGKVDLPDKNGEVDGKSSPNCKTRKLKNNKTCKIGEIVVKLEKSVANVEMNTEKKTEAGEDLAKDDEKWSCKEDRSLKEDENFDPKDSEKQSNLTKNSLNNKEENSLNDKEKIQDNSSPLDEGGGDDLDSGNDDRAVLMDTSIDNQEQDGTDVEDAVDVVNSPSETSETVDSDERSERKTEKRSKKKGEGKNGPKNNDVKNNDVKNNDVIDDVDGLEYKLNDRIDVRYGRGRNATIYHAKITCVDPQAEEGLYYLVHYQGWNARHDEWIGNERIIGRNAKNSRTRNIKEPTKNVKPQPKSTAKPVPKPAPKKNGKNGAGHVGRPLGGGKCNKRTPSPTMNTLMSGRNGNGRGCKNRKDNSNEKTELCLEAKYPSRITRRNSLSLPVEISDLDILDQKSPDTKSENEKDSVASPSRTRRSSKSPSPKRHVDKTSGPKAVKEEMVEDVKLKECVETEKNEIEKDENSVENGPSEMEIDSKVDLEKNLKRRREDEAETSSADSPPAKQKPGDKDSSAEDVFENETTESPTKGTNDAEPEPNVDDTSGPDLTCSEQLPRSCASPDPYTGVFPEGERFYRNGVECESLDTGNRPKEKDSSSSLDEAKVEKPAPTRRTKCRRDRKTRAPSSQSSVDTTECQNGTSNGSTVTVMLSPSWTPRYNFTEGLDELLKNEESSERIRLLTEKIKDIRKVYGELKSEVANIDRKRKRRQKRKREEELSTEENNTRSPRSSPLTTTTAVSTSTLAAVECR